MERATLSVKADGSWLLTPPDGAIGSGGPDGDALLAHELFAELTSDERDALRAKHRNAMDLATGREAHSFEL